MMSCQSAVIGCVLNISLPVLLRLCSHRGTLFFVFLKAIVLVRKALVKCIHLGEILSFGRLMYKLLNTLYWRSFILMFAFCLFLL